VKLNDHSANSVQQAGAVSDDISFGTLDVKLYKIDFVPREIVCKPNRIDRALPGSGCQSNEVIQLL
jgi:hypothetical protein